MTNTRRRPIVIEKDISDCEHEAWTIVSKRLIDYSDDVAITVDCDICHATGECSVSLVDVIQEDYLDWPDA